MAHEIKRLYRSNTDSMVCGVCGGLGDYLRVDPTLVRLVWVLATVMTALVPGLVAYLLAWIIIPPAPVEVWTSDPHPRPENNQG
jgi:phage shock protein PspC (stress-responsive transcriptional regulator)